MQYIYGIHAVDSLLRRNARSVQQLWVQQGRDDKRINKLLELARNQGVPVAHKARQALDEMVQGRHQGAVAEVIKGPVVASEGAQPNLWDEADLLRMVENKGGPVLILVLDGITDPHNLGACLRSADAAGVDAVVVPKDKSADLNPHCAQGGLRRRRGSAVRQGYQYQSYPAGAEGARCVAVRHCG